MIQSIFGYKKIIFESIGRSPSVRPKNRRGSACVESNFFSFRVPTFLRFSITCANSEISKQLVWKTSEPNLDISNHC